MTQAPTHATLWWVLAECLGQAPAGLAAPICAAIATARQHAPATQAQRARRLAAQLAALHEPPVVAWLAAIDPSHAADLAEAVDPRVLAMAVAPAGHPEGLAAWCRQRVAAELGVPPGLQVPPPWYARYDGLPWQALQTQLRRDAALHLGDAAAGEPGLREALTAVLPGEDALLMRQAADVSLNTSRDMPWPISRRTTLTAWRATAPKSLLRLAGEALATLPLPAEHQRWLRLRLPRGMLSSPGE